MRKRSIILTEVNVSVFKEHLSPEKCMLYIVFLFLSPLFLVEVKRHSFSTHLKEKLTTGENILCIRNFIQGYMESYKYIFKITCRRGLTLTKHDKSLREHKIKGSLYIFLVLILFLFQVSKT